MRTNARAAASRIIRAWNLPPGMRPGGESPPAPDWQNSSATEVYEAADAEELDRVMREAISESVYADLADNTVMDEVAAHEVETLAAGDYYSPVSADLDWDFARLEFRLTKSTIIVAAPEKFSVTVRNPFVD